MDEKIKNRKKRAKMIYSAASITRKGFKAFEMIPCKLTPIKRSKEITSANNPVANIAVTRKIFTFSPSFRLNHIVLIK